MNQYHVYEEIGKGAFSFVLKGRRKNTLKYVAIKGLEKVRQRRIVNEVKILSKLNHQNVQKFYNWYETKGHLWLIVEYCAGGNLLSVIMQDEKLSEETTRGLGRQIVTGLQYLHSEGIIYCDLKPANLLLNEFGIIKFNDFGMARRLSDLINSPLDEEISRQKRGCPFYMAPELFKTGGIYSFASDLWSLGCVMYELATGRPPFSSSNFQELVEQIWNQSVKPVKSFSNEFNDLIQQLLQKEPSQRIQWKDLIEHPFWQQTIQCRDMPKQLHYDKWVQGSNASEIAKNQLSRETQIDSKIDILRVSLTVKKNLAKEAGQAYNLDNDEKDCKIDRNQEVNLCDDLPLEKNTEISSQIHLSTQEDRLENINIDLDSKRKELGLNQKPSGTIQNDFTAQNLTQNKRNRNEEYSNLNENYQTMEHSEVQLPEPSVLSPAPNQAKLIPLQQLFSKFVDREIKQIIGNVEIEAISNVSFNREALPSTIRNNIAFDIEGDFTRLKMHFEEIYKQLINKNGSYQQKLNILDYFQTLISGQRIANLVVNCQFTWLFMEFLQTQKQPAMRYRLGMILGLLFCNATEIHPEISQLHIIDRLLTIIEQDMNSGVKRALAAALGEYLFYAATSCDDDPENSIGNIDPGVADRLLNILSNKEADGTLKFYIIKTIENITAKAKLTSKMFCRRPFLHIMYDVQSKSQHPGLCISVYSTFVNLLNRDLSLIAPMLDIVLPDTQAILEDGPPKAIQALLAIINTGVLSTHHFLQQINIADLFTKICSIIEISNQAVRGQGLLSLILIIKKQPSAILDLLDTKFFQKTLDIILTDKDELIQQTKAHLLSLFEQAVPHSWTLIMAELDKMQQRNGAPLYGTQSNLMSKKGSQRLQGPLRYLLVIQKYAAHPALLPFLLKPTLLDLEFQSINSLQIQNTLSPEFQEVRECLFNIYECIVKYPKHVVVNFDYYANQLFQRLCSTLDSWFDVESRFNTLRLIYDITQAIYAETIVFEDRKMMQQIQDSIINGISSRLSSLLNDQDAIAIFALKLLLLAIENHDEILIHIQSLGILEQIFSYFNVGHARLNQTLLKIVDIYLKSTISNMKNLQLDAWWIRATAILNQSHQEPQWANVLLINILQNLLKKQLIIMNAEQIIKIKTDFTSFAAITPLPSVIIDQHLTSFRDIPAIISNIYQILANSDSLTSKQTLNLLTIVTLMFGNRYVDFLSKQDQISLLLHINEKHESCYKEILRVLWMYLQLEGKDIVTTVNVTERLKAFLHINRTQADKETEMLLNGIKQKTGLTY